MEPDNTQFSCGSAERSSVVVKWFESRKSVTLKSKTKKSCPTVLIPKEHFCHRLGITVYFNHVMGHQVEGFTAFSCVFCLNVIYPVGQWLEIYIATTLFYNLASEWDTVYSSNTFIQTISMGKNQDHNPTYKHQWEDAERVSKRSYTKIC